MSDRPHRLLIVDDHPSFRLAARELFTERGYDVVGEADCTAAARMLVDRFSPDLVLIDVGLGLESGIDLARGLTRAHPSLTVLLTSTDDHLSPEQLIASGAWGFIPKLRLPHVDLRAYHHPATGL